MMAKKNLLITAVVLVAVAYGFQYFKNNNSGKQDPFVGKPILQSGIVESIDKITLNTPTTGVTLQKNDGKWEVSDADNYPVNMEKLIKLIENLSVSRIASLVTADPDKMADFNVLLPQDANDKKEHIGSLITLVQGDKILFQLVIGKNRTAVSQNASQPQGAGGSDGTYIRLGEKKAVYLIKDNLTLDTDSKKWLNTVLFRIEKDTIQTIDFKVGKDAFQFTRAEKKDELTLSDIPTGETIESNPVSGLLNDLSEFEIKDIVLTRDMGEKHLKLVSQARIKLFSGDGPSFEVFETGDTEKQYFIQFLPDTKSFSAELIKLNDKWTFEMEGWRIKKWLKAKAEYYQKKK